MRHGLSILVFLISLLPAVSEAGRPRRDRASFKAARLDLRQQRLASGVTLTRAQTALWRAKTAANITGLLNSAGSFFGVLF